MATRGADSSLRGLLTSPFFPAPAAAAAAAAAAVCLQGHLSKGQSCCKHSLANGTGPRHVSHQAWSTLKASREIGMGLIMASQCCVAFLILTLNSLNGYRTQSAHNTSQRADMGVIQCSATESSQIDLIKIQYQTPTLL